MGAAQQPLWELQRAQEKAIAAPIGGGDCLSLEAGIAMAISRTKAQDRAEHVLSRPQGDMKVTLSHGRSGVSLLHNRRVLTRCYASAVGRLQAYSMARILGVALPQPGLSVEVTVPGGVLYRAIAVSGLDLRREEAKMLLAQHLDIADMQRGAAVGS